MQFEITINIEEQTDELVYVNYNISIQQHIFCVKEILFRDVYQQIIHQLENKSGLLKYIFSKDLEIPLALLQQVTQYGLLNTNDSLDIIEEVPVVQIRQQLKQISQTSISASYCAVSDISHKLRRILTLHQIIMVDHISNQQELITKLDACIDYIQQYAHQEQQNIMNFILMRLMFILNDKYRLQSQLMRKDLCQQTLQQAQLYKLQITNIESMEYMIMAAQVDLLEADYVYSIQKKVTIKLQNITNILSCFKVITIYDETIKPIIFPIIQLEQSSIIHKIDEKLIKILQIIFGCLQIQEITLFGDELVRLADFFNQVNNLRIRYTYHLCLSQCLPQQMALSQCLQAYDLAVEINDLHDVMEIVLTSQLLFIETEQLDEGIQFTQQFIDKYGKQQIKQQFKDEYRMLCDNLTYMSIAEQQ